MYIMRNDKHTPAVNVQGKIMAQRKALDVRVYFGEQILGGS